MRPVSRTYIYILDDHRNISEDVKNRFSDHDRYAVKSYQNDMEFRKQVMVNGKRNTCRIAIIVLNDNCGQAEMAKKLADDIKAHNFRTVVILVYRADKIDDIASEVTNADAWIPKNNNSLLRIHNMVKKIISEHTIEIIKRKRNLALFVMLTFTLLSVISAIIAGLFYPNYF